MEVKKGFKASARQLVLSPTKARRVADLVRNANCVQAIAMLEKMPQKAARPLVKLLKSVVQNAVYQSSLEKNELAEESLCIKELRVDEGPVWKRVWPRARGRRDILLKRLCHISLVIDVEEAEEKMNRNSSTDKRVKKGVGKTKVTDKTEEVGNGAEN